MNSSCGYRSSRTELMVLFIVNSNQAVLFIMNSNFFGRSRTFMDDFGVVRVRLGFVEITARVVNDIGSGS